MQLPVFLLHVIVHLHSFTIRIWRLSLSSSYSIHYNCSSVIETRSNKMEFISTKMKLNLVALLFYIMLYTVHIV